MSCLRFWLLVAVVTLSSWWLVSGSVVERAHVRGGSMLPALHDGDSVMVNRLAYGLRVAPFEGWLLEWGGPYRGDMVVFTSPLDGKRLVKRITGVPGDVVEGRQVPPGHYFVTGDNAFVSLDSRSFGCVPRWRVLGRVQRL
jgi:signal peptidase I